MFFDLPPLAGVLAGGVFGPGAVAAGLPAAAPQNPQVALHFFIIIVLYLPTLQYLFNCGHCFGVPSLHSPVPAAAPPAAGAFVAGAADALPPIGTHTLHVIAH